MLPAPRSLVRAILRTALMLVASLASLLLLSSEAHGLARARQATRPDTARADSTRGPRYPTLRISGFIQVFTKVRFDDDGSGTTEPALMRVQRARITFQGAVNRHVRYEMDIDPRSPEVTGLLRDAFISLDYIPNHQLRIGQQKTLFGYENPISSSRLFVVNRSEISDNLSRGVNLRDNGLGLVGSVDLSEHLRFEDALTIVNGGGLNTQEDSTHRKNIWGRVGLRYRRDDVTLRFGLSGGSGDVREAVDPGPPLEPAFLYTFSRLGTDVVLDHPRAFLAAEFVTGENTIVAPLGESERLAGYYVLAAGKTRWNAGPIVRYDVFEDFRRVTVGAYFGRPADDVSLLFNYEVFRDEAGPHDHRVYLRLQTRF